MPKTRPSSKRSSNSPPKSSRGESLSVPPTDLLAPLVELSGVQEAADNARQRVDSLLWDRSLQTKGQALAADCSLQNARASAAIDGIDISLTAWASGDAFDDSPIGHAAAGVWRLEEALRDLGGIWATAPSQALARMHSLVARDVVADEELGRPRRNDEADDPLRVKALPDVPTMQVRLAALTDIATGSTAAPAVVEAAIVHGELLALRPFGWGSGPIARAAMRLVLAHRGLDPDLLVMTDAAVYSIGRPAYVDAVRSYISGTPDGVARWIRFCVESVSVGARLSSDRLGQLP